MPKLIRAREPQDAEEERKIHKVAGSRHAPGDWITRARIISLSWQGLRKDTYRLLLDGLTPLFDRTKTTPRSVGFEGRAGEGHRVIFNLVPTESSVAEGLRFEAYLKRLSEHLGVGKGDAPTPALGMILMLVHSEHLFLGCHVPELVEAHLDQQPPDRRGRCVGTSLF